MPPTLKKLDARFLDTHRLVFRFYCREQTRSAHDGDHQIKKLDGGCRENHDFENAADSGVAQRTKKNAAN